MKSCDETTKHKRGCEPTHPPGDECGSELPQLPSHIMSLPPTLRSRYTHVFLWSAGIARLTLRLYSCALKSLLHHCQVIAQRGCYDTKQWHLWDKTMMGQTLPPLPKACIVPTTPITAQNRWGKPSHCHPTANSADSAHSAEHLQIHQSNESTCDIAFKVKRFPTNSLRERNPQRCNCHCHRQMGMAPKLCPNFIQANLLTTPQASSYNCHLWSSGTRWSH